MTQKHVAVEFKLENESGNILWEGNDTRPHAGQYTLTAYCVDNSDIYAVQTLIVEEAPAIELLDEEGSLANGGIHQVSCASGETQKFKITPDKSTAGNYVIYSSDNSADTYVTLYKVTDGEYELLRSDDDGAEDNNNFRLQYQLEAGTEYCYEVRGYSYRAADFTVHFVKMASIKEVTLQCKDTYTLEELRDFTGSLSITLVYDDETTYTVDGIDLWRRSVDGQNVLTYSDDDGNQVNIALYDAEDNYAGIPDIYTGGAVPTGTLFLQACVYGKTVGEKQITIQSVSQETTLEVGTEAVYNLQSESSTWIRLQTEDAGSYYVGMSLTDCIGTLYGGLFYEKDGTLTCVDSSFDLSQGILFDAEADETYYVLVSAYDDPTDDETCTIKLIEAPQVTSMELFSGLKVSSIVAGADFDVSGLTVKLHYSNGEEQTVQVDHYDSYHHYVSVDYLYDENEDYVYLSASTRSGNYLIRVSCREKVLWVPIEVRGLLDESLSNPMEINQTVTFDAAQLPVAVSFTAPETGRYHLNDSQLLNISVKYIEHDEEDGDYIESYGTDYLRWPYFRKGVTYVIILDARNQETSDKFTFSVENVSELAPINLLEADGSLADGGIHQVSCYPGATQEFRITPDESTAGNYVIYSSDTSDDTYVTLYKVTDGEHELLQSNDDDGDNLNFRLQYQLESGVEYCYEVREYNYGTADFTVHFEKKAGIKEITLQCKDTYTLEELRDFTGSLSITLVYDDETTYTVDNYDIRISSVNGQRVWICEGHEGDLVNVALYDEDGNYAGIPVIYTGEIVPTGTLSLQAYVDAKKVGEKQITIQGVSQETALAVGTEAVYDLQSESSTWIRLQTEDAGSYYVGMSLMDCIGTLYGGLFYEKDGTLTCVDSSFDLSQGISFDAEADETYYVLVSAYDGTVTGSETCTIKLVEALQVTSMELVSGLDVSSIVAGANFDVSGLTVKLHYSNGEEQTVQVDHYDTYHNYVSVAYLYDENEEYSYLNANTPSGEYFIRISCQDEILRVPLNVRGLLDESLSNPIEINQTVEFDATQLPVAVSFTAPETGRYHLNDNQTFGISILQVESDGDSSYVDYYESAVDIRWPYFQKGVTYVIILNVQDRETTDSLTFSVEKVVESSETIDLLEEDGSLANGGVHQISCAYPGATQELRITPDESTAGNYVIYSSDNSADTYVTLYQVSDGEYKLLQSDDDGAGYNNNFRLQYQLEAGTEYCYEVRGFGYRAADFTVHFVKKQEVKSCTFKEAERDISIFQFIDYISQIPIIVTYEDDSSEEITNWNLSDDEVNFDRLKSTSIMGNSFQLRIYDSDDQEVEFSWEKFKSGEYTLRLFSISDGEEGTKLEELSTHILTVTSYPEDIPYLNINNLVSVTILANSEQFFVITPEQTGWYYVNVSKELEEYTETYLYEMHDGYLSFPYNWMLQKGETYLLYMRNYDDSERSGSVIFSNYTTVETCDDDAHNWDEGSVTKAATCTENGVKTYTCTVCGETKTEEIEALGHSYSSEWTTDKAATCTAAGSKSHHCTLCDAKTDVTEIAAIGHQWNSETVTKAATCTEAGVKTYTCTACSETKTEEIEALGHSYSSDWTIDQAATCTAAGSKSHHCTLCDAKTAVTEIAATGHNWNGGTVTKAATCTENGVKTYTCIVCGETKAEEIKATGHSYSSEWTTDKAATCTEAGSKSRHCTACGAKTDVTEIAATGHSWGDYTVTKEPTALKTGTKTRTCITCGEKDSATVEKLTPTINLNQTSLTLKVGKSAEIKVSGLAKGDSVSSWKSSNTKIVTVDKKGKITAKSKTGTADVTVKLKSGKTETIPVTVEPIKTTKITVSSRKVTVEKGKTQTLKPTVTPSDSTEKVTYTSSDTKVATVSSKGVIKAKAVGTATITVASGSKSVKVKVTVPARTTKITVTPKTVNLTKGKTKTLKATVVPSNSIDKITYTTSNKKVATVNSKGVITAKGVGTATITVKSGTKSVKVTVKVKK